MFWVFCNKFLFEKIIFSEIGTKNTCQVIENIKHQTLLRKADILSLDFMASSYIRILFPEKNPENLKKIAKSTPYIQHW